MSVVGLKEIAHSFHTMQREIMPHDKNGQPLKSGDTVEVTDGGHKGTTGVVIEYIALETCEPGGVGATKRILTVNAKQVVKVDTPSPDKQPVLSDPDVVPGPVAKSSVG